MDKKIKEINKTNNKIIRRIMKFIGNIKKSTRQIKNFIGQLMKLIRQITK